MTARDYLVKLDNAARDLGLTQAEFCRRAGLDEFGHGISRAYYRGDCKLSMFLQMARAAGYEVTLVKREPKGESDH